MRIPLTEIWNFIDLIDQQEKGWSYALHAADVQVSDIGQSVLFSLRQDEQYDTELLPSLFTFREMLWQPDVYKSAAQSMPGIRILKAFCEETLASYEGKSFPATSIYSSLIQGMVDQCVIAEQLLEGNPKTLTVTKVLSELRRKSFPIIKFFIFHPKNRVDYYRDAINRLNYAVKVMLTEFNGRYTDLDDPYWIVTFQKESIKPEKAKITKTETA